MNRITLMVLCFLAPLAVAQSPAPAQSVDKPPAAQAHRSEDIAKHRQMARAHEEAAKCLESALPEQQCQERLRETCKGIAVGQYCGMRHAH